MQNYLDKIYNDIAFQNYRWKDVTHWSLQEISSIPETFIKVFHHDKMAQLSVLQKQAFTEEQKSYMNEDQLAALEPRPL